MDNITKIILALIALIGVATFAIKLTNKKKVKQVGNKVRGDLAGGDINK